MEVKSVVAGAPGYRALLGASLLLTGLALDADLHEVVPADGAIVDLALPLPHRHRVPLLYDEFTLATIDLHVCVHH